MRRAGWYGIHGPRGLPKPIVDKLNATARQMVQERDVLERFASLNLEPISGTPEEFAKFIRADVQKYAEIARKANIQPQ